MAITKSITCRDAVALVSDYLDGGLTWRARRRLERHLADCGACTAYLEQMRVTVATAGTLTEDDLPDDVLNGLLDVFQKFHADPNAAS